MSPDCLCFSRNRHGFLKTGMVSPISREFYATAGWQNVVSFQPQIPDGIRPWTSRIGEIIRVLYEPGFPLFSRRLAWFSQKPAGFRTNQIVFTPENDGKM